MLEKLIEVIKGANWETLGAFALVMLAALGRFLKGFSLGLNDEKPPQKSEDQYSSPRMKRWDESFERLEKNTQDIKAETRQLGRDSGRDHELLIEIKDGIGRIERALKKD